MYTKGNDCDSIFTDKKDIKITLNLQANVNDSIGQQMIFASLNAGYNVFLADNILNNFYFGNINQAVINSKTNLNWKPPLSNLAPVVLVFQIPISIVGNYDKYPTGWVNVEQE